VDRVRLLAASIDTAGSSLLLTVGRRARLRRSQVASLEPTLPWRFELTLTADGIIVRPDRR
jgi:hypothetical protein